VGGSGGWTGSGEVDLLGSTLVLEAEKSSDNLKVLGVKGAVAIDKGFGDLRLTFGMAPERVNMIAPRSCCLIVQYTILKGG
jgi:hypothetical protein